MTFFARPDLSDVQFKQLPGSVLTLSGETRIASPSGLTLIGESGNFIPINLTSGNTDTNILTYICGQIILLPQTGGGSGGSGVYSGDSPTTCSVGGLVCGSAIAGCSISGILEQILVPAIPLTTSLSIATGGNDRQFGDSGVGNLCYSAVKKTNQICFICLSTDGSGTYGCTIPAGAGNTCSGTVSYTFAPICASPTSTGCTITSVQYKICGKTVSTAPIEVSTGGTFITWKNKTFSFGNSTTTINSATLNALSNGILSTGKAMTTTITLANQFYYYAYPKTFGLPSFTVNGLGNNAWGNPSTGSLSTITYVNSNGYGNQYYVARSDNKITGSYTIKVS